MGRYTVFFDNECPLCIREMALVREQNVSGSLKTVPIQGNEAALTGYGIGVTEAMTLLHVVDEEGGVLKGMAALRLVYRECGGRPIARIWNWPLLRVVADWGYPIFARYRYYLPRWLLPRPQCEDGVCHLPPHRRGLGGGSKPRQE